jgi:DNA-binding CsgD family transcriptional regulator
MQRPSSRRPPARRGEAPAREDPLAALSDREREVAALLLERLSYAQIAKELYVTRSTVAFHLSNAYAKTGTATRHDFVQLVRPQHPSHQP